MIAKRNFITTTGLAVLAATVGSAVADAGVRQREGNTLQQIEKYCAASWRNARIAEQDWDDCTQQAFERLLQKIPREKMEQAITLRESTERRELNRSIWATIQRWRRTPRYQSLLPEIDSASRPSSARPELREEIDRACQHLTPRQNKIIQLWMQGHTASEIAGQLDMKPARVSDEKYKALKTLRNHLPADIIG